MFLFVIFLILIILSKLSFRKDVDSLLSKVDTNVINGIFIILVFLSHCYQYVNLSSHPLDFLYDKFRSVHTQLIVSTFLTFSGFGIMEQYKKRGKSYFSNFFDNRILKTLFQFDIVVLLYLLMNKLLNIRYGFYVIVSSLIGYESVGNSNWYIFAILCMYMVVYLSYKINPNKLLENCFIGTCGYITAMLLINKPTYFYDTVLCFVFGMLLSKYKEKTFNLIFEKRILISLVTGLIFIITYKFKSIWFVMNVHAISFVILIIIALSIVSIQSPILSFFGNHLFSIYSLQRIPMKLLEKYYLIGKLTNISFTLLSLVLTLIIALIFDNCIAYSFQKNRRTQ